MDAVRQPESSARARNASRGFAVLTMATLVLIVFGALVRANGAGLACPDWPLCHGQAIPNFDFRIALEWGHRVFASVVSLGLFGLTFYVWRDEALRPRVRSSLSFVWIALAVQIVLGGLTVLLGLAPWTVTSHLLVGSSICASLLWISLDLRAASKKLPAASSTLTAVGATLICVAGVLMLAQMALGGLVSSHFAGLACGSFPTCNGDSIAPTLSGLVGIHVIHRLNAFALVAVFAALAFVNRRAGAAGTLALHGVRLILLQVAVGVLNVLMRLPVEVTGLHSALAAGLVLVTVAMVRELVYAGVSERDSAALGATS